MIRLDMLWNLTSVIQVNLLDPDFSDKFINFKIINLFHHAFPYLGARTISSNDQIKLISPCMFTFSNGDLGGLGIDSCNLGMPLDINFGC